MKKKSPRLQLNIRLTPEQNELIKQKLEQTQISKTQLIIDSINNNPIYMIPNLEQTISQIKYLGNKVNELSNKIINSLPLFVVSLASKKGWAKAKIKQANNNKRVANNNHFLILELFRV